MEKRTILTVFLVILVISFLILVVVPWKGAPKMFPENTVGSPGGQTPGPSLLPPSPSSSLVTRGLTSTNVIMPPPDTFKVPTDVAIPQLDLPINTKSAAHFKVYDLKVQGGKFIPSTINVYRGDIVRINLTAIEQNIDFTQPEYGLKVSVAKGETKTVNFGDTAIGKYTFFCSICGGPTQGPIGYLVVAPR